MSNTVPMYVFSKLLVWTGTKGANTIGLQITSGSQNLMCYSKHITCFVILQLHFHTLLALNIEQKLAKQKHTFKEHDCKQVQTHSLDSFLFF